MAARKRAVDDAMSVAWHTASLNAYAYHQPKKMPKLETLLHSDAPTASRGQTTDEQIAVLKSIMSKRKR